MLWKRTVVDERCRLDVVIFFWARAGRQLQVGRLKAERRLGGDNRMLPMLINIFFITIFVRIRQERRNFFGVVFELF